MDPFGSVLKWIPAVFLILGANDADNGPLRQAGGAGYQILELLQEQLCRENLIQNDACSASETTSLWMFGNFDG